MRTNLFISATCMIFAASALAGSLNVVHVGPKDVLKFKVSAGDAAQDFTLAHGANTGAFILPDKPSRIEGFNEAVPALEIPASEEARIAVLTPAEDGFKWHLFPAKPTEGKWALRIINLSEFPANVLSGKELMEIPVAGESAVDVTAKSQIRVSIPNTVNLTYGGNEPCAVVAFVYRTDNEWKAILIPDR
jgi:hypothetical protein